MTAPAIVERIDVVGHIALREFTGLVDVLLDALFLQAAEEGLGHSVVPAVALSARSPGLL